MHVNMKKPSRLMHERYLKMGNILGKIVKTFISKSLKYPVNSVF